MFPKYTNSSIANHQIPIVLPIQLRYIVLKLASFYVEVNIGIPISAVS